MAECALQIVARRLRVGRPRLRDEARARADAKRRGGMRPVAAQRDGLADQARLRRDLRIIGGSAHAAAPRASARYNLPAIVQREVAIAVPDHERKDRPLRQLFIVGVGAAWRLLRRQQAKRRRGCDDPLHALAESRQRHQAKFVGHAIIGPDFLERRFPAKPLAEIGPDRKTRPQGSASFPASRCGCYIREAPARCRWPHRDRRREPRAPAARR